MRYLLSIFVLFLSTILTAQTIFNETIGTPGGTTGVGIYTGYSNYPTLTYTGTADVRTSLPSTGYAGATGSGNVFVTNSVGTNFEISNINTSSYTSLALTFGHYKTTTASNGSELVVEVSSDGASYTPLSYTRPTGSGTASWLLVSPTGTIPSTSNLRIRFRQTSSSVQFRVDDIRLTGTLIAACTDPGEPTTLSTSLTGSPTCISSTITWNTVAGNGTNHLVLVSTAAIAGTPVDNTLYTASTVYGSGGSSISGAQVVYNGTGNSVVVTGLAPGTLYHVVVYEFNLSLPNCTNYASVNNGASFTTLTGCGPSTPQLLGILANSCDASEGLNEYFVFQNGTSALPLSSLNITYPSLGFDYCNSGCGTNTLLNNASAISALNSSAGCALFTFADPIPAQATVVVFTGNPPTAPPNFSAQCGQLYYAIFCNNTSDVSGRFANSGTGTRTLTVDFGATTDVVSYDLSSITNADGAYISYDYPGTPSYTVLSNCAGALSVTLINWEGKAIEEGNLLSWTTIAELDNSHFIVRKSIDGIQFTDLETVPGQTSKMEMNYSVLDRDVTENTTYYQLIDVDLNGNRNASAIIAIHNKEYQTEFSIINGYLVYSNWAEIKSLTICDATGKLVLNTEENGTLQSNRITLNSGFYFVYAITKSGKTLTQKLFLDGTF